jgi:hypothetical protein
MRIAATVVLLITASIGCSGSPSASSDAEPALIPAKGVITIDGKPLAHALVTFLPNSGAGGVAETKDDGSYELVTSFGKRGVPADEYVVAVTYVVNDKGEPQGMGAQSSLVTPASMAGAEQLLPPEYSDLGRSKLRATVTPQSATRPINIDLKGPMREHSKLKADKDAEGDAGQAKSQPEPAKEGVPEGASNPREPVEPK